MVLNSKFKLLTVRELFKSMPSIKREWKWKTPMQKWCFLYSIGKAACSLIRVAVFQEHATNIHWFGYFSFVYVTIDMILSLYTVCYYINHGEMILGLPSTCIAALVCGVRYICYLFRIQSNSLSQWQTVHSLIICLQRVSLSFLTIYIYSFSAYSIFVHNFHKSAI